MKKILGYRSETAGYEKSYIWSEIGLGLRTLAQANFLSELLTPINPEKLSFWSHAWCGHYWRFVRNQEIGVFPCLETLRKT